MDTFLTETSRLCAESNDKHRKRRSVGEHHSYQHTSDLRRNSKHQNDDSRKKQTTKVKKRIPLIFIDLNVSTNFNFVGAFSRGSVILYYNEVQVAGN
jgi:hypothetical protein